MAQQAAYAGTGRRKDSVARIRLVPGNGQITINKEDVTSTFHTLTWFKI